MAGRVFLTGGTGFLGSNIGYKLLRLGYEVIFLVRKVANATSETRLNTALRVIDPDFNLDKYSYQIMAGDICLPKLGLSAENLAQLKRDKPKTIYNCAGSIAFSQKEYDKTWNTNVEGLRKVIAFAQDLGISLDHVSTAYQVGNSEGTAQEKIEKSSNQHFNNVYEETKYIGEVLVSESGLKYAIYRPGIVIGAENGVTLSFDGYYTYQRSFWVLKNLILNRLKREKTFYDGSGIRVDGEKLILPVRIKSSFDANLNLVPVDWLAKMIVTLSEKELSRKRVFHLTHPSPPLIKWVILTSLDIMGICGVELINPDQSMRHDNQQLADIQQMVDKGIGDYEAYTNQSHRFDDYQTVILSNSSYTPPPPIDRAFLERTLNYAIAHNFRR